MAGSPLRHSSKLATLVPVRRVHVEEDVRKEKQVYEKVKPPLALPAYQLDVEAHPERHGESDVDEQHRLGALPQARHPGVRMANIPRQLRLSEHSGLQFARFALLLAGHLPAVESL